MLNDEWREEAVRLHRRYVIEVVEACGLCPWAEPARVRGRVRDAVLLEKEDDVACEASLALLDAWAKDEGMEVGFLLYPRLSLGARAFEAFSGELLRRDSAGHEVGQAPFVFAAFHPAAEPDVSEAERLIPFLRRTPDACIQVLRARVVDRARNGTPQGTGFVALTDLAAFESAAATVQLPLREQIANANLETAQRLGIDVLKERLDAIGRDRHATYAALERREQALAGISAA